MPKCFLCSFHKTTASSLIDPPVLHSFPSKSKSSLRLMWMSACGLNNEVDCVDNVKICSKHFVESDYVDLRGREFGGRIKLKADSVPTVSVPFPVSVDQPPFLASVNEVISLSTGSESESTEQVGSELVQISSNNLEEKLCLKTKNSEAGGSTPKKRRIYTPRYIGDLGSPHVATPRRAKKTLQFVKEVVKKKNKQVKLLQQQNRRFIKKIRTLKMLLEHLTTTKYN